MNIGYYLQAAACAHPDRPAVSLGTKLCWNYAEFFARVAHLAAGLRAIPGVVAGDRVALAMKNCPQYLEVLSAAWHAGLCAVPVNAKLHPREFEYILGNAGVRLCFATPDLSEALSAFIGRVEPLAQVIDVESNAYPRLFVDEALPLQPVNVEAPAWLFYTSGTTGRPKGATLTHRSLAAMTWRYYADVDALGERDCIIHAAPLSHATGLYSLPHTAKASHHVVPASQGVDLDEIFDLLNTYDTVTLFAAPTMLTRMVARAEARPVRLEAIKTIFYGGAPMYIEDLKRALACFGPRLWQGFGQGEMPNTICCLSKARHVDTAHPKYENRLTTVGVPRTGVEVRVVDAEDRDVPTGEIGEVIARSDVCMSGYWNNPEATASTLRGGWLHTGDLGAFDEDGFLTLKDRSKDVIISGGSNIYPREVEEVLLMHPDVLEASVIGRRHPEWGEEVVAFVVPRPSRAVAEADLDRLCLANIARFKRPKAYYTIEALPKNNYGKVLKTELRERLRAMSKS